MDKGDQKIDQLKRREVKTSDEQSKIPSFMKNHKYFFLRGVGRVVKSSS
jgi:hypothetical protein